MLPQWCDERWFLLPCISLIVFYIAARFFWPLLFERSERGPKGRVRGASFPFFVMHASINWKLRFHIAKIPLFFDHAAKKSVKNCYHFETSSFQGAPTNFRLVYVFRHPQRMRFGFKKKISKIDRKLPEISRLKKSEIFCTFRVIQL